MTQHVHEHTRFRDGQSDSLLDLILTDRSDMVSNIDFKAPFGKSDHVCLSYSIDRAPTSKAATKENLNYYKGNYLQMREELSERDWDSTLKDKDIEQAWSSFEAILKESIDRNIPRSRPNTSNRKKWMTKEAQQAVKLKHKAHNKFRKHKTQENQDNFKQAKNNATKVARAARENYESNLAENIKDNPKEFWSYVKSQTGTVSGIAPMKQKDGTLAIDPMAKATTLNEYFAGVFTIEDTDSIPTPRQEDLNSQISDIVFTEPEIQDELSKIKSGSSAGPDGIHPRVLKETCMEIAKPLAIIFNISMKEGRLPKAWKEATVVPIYKKGPRSDPGNYRPVSLTSTCGKLMERIIRKYLLQHFDNNNLLSPEQHGFRQGRSCTTQLLSVTEDWSQWLDDHTPYDCIYLDYRKAFDSVPHQRLLKKARASGVQGKLLDWLESFLSERKQRVRVESALSDWVEVTSGIPQGSVLGPTLFLLFINDLPSTITSISALFADDTKVFRTINSTDDSTELQKDMDALDEWSRTWQMPFNASKCKLIHFGRNNPRCNYTIGGTAIAEVDQETDLGVTFDQTLTFSTHHDKSTKKANSRLGLIKRSFRQLKQKPFVQLYKTLVRPIVEYCSVVTSPVLKRDVDRLEKVQRRATRLVEGMVDRPYSTRLRQLNLQSLKYRRKRADVLQAYRIFNKVDNLEKSQFFKVSSETRTRSNGCKLFKKHCNSKIRANTFSQRVTDNWNSLPKEVVSAPTINRFKSALEKHWKEDPVRFLSNEPEYIRQVSQGLTSVREVHQ